MDDGGRNEDGSCLRLLSAAEDLLATFIIRGETLFKGSEGFKGSVFLCDQLVKRNVTLKRFEIWFHKNIEIHTKQHYILKTFNINPNKYLLPLIKV